ncbi:MAG: ribosome-binding factor A [Stappia sp.]|uniref:30S ribosome-binding factor RbfA n=1 Tax=Stappia sp. TaxID=1870903 RepID=UPI000C4793EF|nr:30S ribosome-binding factor RbfA [Stappia sp.]MAA99116.1 ribosome-binding factor A [Stappia sp.]MBM19426.1 ribosome-binding factor A [Stappia sp.]
MAPSNRTPAGMPSQRQLRVGELVRKDVSDILSRGTLSDPSLDGVIISVPEVRMTPDLRVATCLVMPLGGRDGDKVVEGLNRSARVIRRELARRLTMKFMPDLRFVLDTRFDDDDRITTLLNSDDVRRDLDDEDGDDDAHTDGGRD